MWEWKTNEITLSISMNKVIKWNEMLYNSLLQAETSYNNSHMAARLSHYATEIPFIKNQTNKDVSFI